MTGDNNFCSRCGEKIQTEDEYCSKCGYRLSYEKEVELKRRVSKYQINIIIGVLLFCIVIVLFGHFSSQYVTNLVPQDTMSSLKTYAYVTNYNDHNVSVIDTETNNVIATVLVGSRPRGIAVSPDGTKVYVVNEGNNSISEINTAKNIITAIVPVGNQPNGIVITPDGEKLYVTNTGDSNITVIDTATDTFAANVPLNSDPSEIAISPNGERVYVNTDKSVYVIDTITNTVITNLDIGKLTLNEITGIAVTPDGTKVYVTAFSDMLDIMDKPCNFIFVIDTATNTIVAKMLLVRTPCGVAVNPDGTKAYVVNSDCTVSVIDTATNTVTSTFNKDSDETQCDEIAFTSDGKRVYITNSYYNNVSVIDTATNTVIDTVTVGSKPFGIAIGKIRTD